MFKKFFALFFAISLFLPSARGVKAAEEFLIDSSVEYRIGESGKTSVSHTISLENVFSTLYAKEYSLLLQGIDVVNPQVSENGNPLRFDLKKEGDQTSFLIFFDQAMVGKGRSRTFEVSYDNFSFAKKTGEVWEISIPKIGSESAFRNYTARLIVPISIGKEAYMSPKAFQRLEEGTSRVYIFNKEVITQTGVSAGFGEFQVFSFTLNYHLENPLSKNATNEIALPPDTAFQKVHYETINPAPKEIYVDADGNWIGIFDLLPRQKLDIVAQGAVQIFSDPFKFPQATSEYLTENLKETKYWQTSSPVVKDLASRLGTARAIYDYVSKNLTYDYDRVKPNVSRLGAETALNNPGSAICMEYTDAFIALARSAGIPAREVNGFAYTENPKIQPLSLVSDVLHSWPEYWDQTRGAWIPVDPTWASTTGGVDYFNKLDLRHFTFVIHGLDPEKPYPAGSYKLGANPQKDVFVSFGELPEEAPGGIEITISNKKPVPFLNSKLKVTVRNTGKSSFYNLRPLVSFDNEATQTESIEILPPYAVYEFFVNVPFSFLGSSTPEIITVVVENSRVEIPSFKRWVIIYNLVAIFLAVALAALVILLKLKKINLGDLGLRIGSLLKRHGKDNSRTDTPLKL
ncbi:hypothetical protein HY502_00390 [Candidatus Woesebacteria bacterium]|nr:hypothetical protein [Candidatus Woesebacteria bacterium]